MEYVRKISSELATGDVVNVYGMRVRLDECHIWTTDNASDLAGGLTVYRWAGTVLNSAELPSSMGPIAQWAVQGNDLASWSVELATVTA